ncbi:MAG: hypothetical protein HYV40_00445 [Candidatus Levybacteria bacterium]|nr:hypothetical protein [Candidatus Levybacteria bacterium]
MKLRQLASLFLTFSTLIQLILPTTALAHTAVSSESIQGFIHVKPHEPIVGKQAQILIELSDTKNNFRADACSCELTITSLGGINETIQLTQWGKTASFSIAQVPRFPKEIPTP